MIIAIAVDPSYPPPRANRASPLSDDDGAMWQIERQPARNNPRNPLRNNAVFNTAAKALRLSGFDGPPSRWSVPAFLREVGLSYHAREARWPEDGVLVAASRGQEFVADVGYREDARRWLGGIVEAIGASP